MVAIDKEITVYKDIFSKEPHYLSVRSALERIRTGKSASKIEEIRSKIDKERADGLKKNLPSVCFSARFEGPREDKTPHKHSGFIVLDFDDLDDAAQYRDDLRENPFIFAAWLSPRGNGVKALVRIAKAEKHREHFAALQDEFNGMLDKSGVNVSRVCYESYDPDIYINENAEVYKTIKRQVAIEQNIVSSDHSENFKKLVSWLSNKREAFVQGERNIFIFKLACACARFGMPQPVACNLIINNFVIAENNFSTKECELAVASAYKSVGGQFGTAQFTSGVLTYTSSKKEVEVDREPEFYDKDVKVKDVIYGEDVKDLALNIYNNGYEKVPRWDVPMLDKHFKRKRKELTLLSGIGNYGKSFYWKSLILFRCIKFKEKWAIFGPEDNPAEEFYHELAEMYLGADCTAYNPNKPNKMLFDNAYDFVSKHIFYVYPETKSPTPAYVKERFLELIIKENVSGVVIDPFNQLDNDYGARSDKYLESILSDFMRFAQQNDIFFDIIAHPKAMRKDGAANYPMPDVFDIADGAMWNNKMHNILIYHRPNHQQDPTDPTCEVAFKKIKKQKITGEKGIITITLDRPTRRFIYDGVDILGQLLNDVKKPVEIPYEKPSITPNTSFLTSEKEDAPF
jgi:hypothetical protein